MPSTSIPPPISFQALKVPILDDLIKIFKTSSHFIELQHDNTLVKAHITKAELWKPFMDSIITIVHECIVKKKTALPSKQKLLT